MVREYSPACGCAPKGGGRPIASSRKRNGPIDEMACTTPWFGVWEFTQRASKGFSVAELPNLWHMASSKNGNGWIG
jgi:hypothetical protein